MSKVPPTKRPLVDIADPWPLDLPRPTTSGTQLHSVCFSAQGLMALTTTAGRTFLLRLDKILPDAAGEAQQQHEQQQQEQNETEKGKEAGASRIPPGALVTYVDGRQGSIFTGCALSSDGGFLAVNADVPESLSRPDAHPKHRFVAERGTVAVYRVAADAPQMADRLVLLAVIAREPWPKQTVALPPVVESVLGNNEATWPPATTCLAFSPRSTPARLVLAGVAYNEQCFVHAIDATDRDAVGAPRLASEYAHEIQQRKHGAPLQSSRNVATLLSTAFPVADQAVQHTSVSYSRDGALLAVAGGNYSCFGGGRGGFGSVAVVDAASGTALGQLTHNDCIYAAKFLERAGKPAFVAGVSYTTECVIGDLKGTTLRAVKVTSCSYCALATAHGAGGGGSSLLFLQLGSQTSEKTRHYSAFAFSGAAEPPAFEEAPSNSSSASAALAPKWLTERFRLDVTARTATSFESIICADTFSHRGRRYSFFGFTSNGFRMHALPAAAWKVIRSTTLLIRHKAREGAPMQRAFAEWNSFVLTSMFLDPWAFDDA